jgi:hypothetical protein
MGAPLFCWGILQLQRVRFGSGLWTDNVRSIPNAENWSDGKLPPQTDCLKLQYLPPSVTIGAFRRGRRRGVPLPAAAWKMPSGSGSTGALPLSCIQHWVLPNPLDDLPPPTAPIPHSESGCKGRECERTLSGLNTCVTSTSRQQSGLTHTHTHTSNGAGISPSGRPLVLGQTGNDDSRAGGPGCPLVHIEL